MQGQYLPNILCLGDTDMQHADARPVSPAQVRLMRIAEVTYEPVRWLVQGRVPLGKLSILDGDPGTGKSTITLDLAATVSTNGIMPDGSRGDLDAPAGVVLISAEDNAADTIRPRLDAAGANLDRIVALQSVYDSGGGERQATLADVDQLGEAIAQADAKLVVIDPLAAFLPARTNAHRDQDIRNILTPLARLAERTGAAILVVRHLTKVPSGNALYRGSGSIGIIGAARVGLLAARDPDDSVGRRRVLAVAKNNLGPVPPALVYQIETAPNGASRIVWDGESQHSADALLAAPVDLGERTARDEAVEFLRTVLRDGSRTALAVKREAREAGIAEATLRRAQRALGIASRRVGYGKDGEWRWELPGGDV